MHTLTSIRRFYRYYLLLIAIFAFSCKKQTEPVNVAPSDQSSSTFFSELHAQWVRYAKDHPSEASLAPNEKLDWDKIVLRISSDAKRSINYYVPILTDNQSCNKALELSFGAEKEFYQAAVRTYTAPSATAGSSSEARRLQIILYNFSTIGLKIPKVVIDREKAIQNELKQKNIEWQKNQKLSLATKDRAGSSMTQSTRECQTAVTFDCYYTFSKHSWNSNYDIQTVDYFRSHVFNSWNAMGFDYDEPLFGRPNDYTFYNISDNVQLGNMIHTTLIQAANATKSRFNLMESYVSFYYYDVLYSTCGSSSGGGGGVGEPSQPEAIISEFPEYPCATALVNQLDEFETTIGTALKIIFGDQNKKDLIFEVGPHLMGSNIDGQFYQRSGNTYRIYINPYILQNSSKEYMIATFYHEAIHAYLAERKASLGAAQYESQYGPWGLYNDRLLGVQDDAHLNMGRSIYVNAIRDAIMSFNPSFDINRAIALAESGILTLDSGKGLINSQERNTTLPGYTGTRCN